MSCFRWCAFTAPAAAAALVALAGCATVDKAAVQQRMQGKAIAVTSTIGPKVRLLWIGTTAFNNEYGEVVLPDFDLDTRAVEAAVAALQASGRYASVGVVRGAIPRDDGSLSMPGDVNADFVVAIGAWTIGDPVFLTNQSFRGVGVAQRTFLGIPARTHVFASLEVALHDSSGRRLESLGEFTSQPVPRALKSGGTAGNSGSRPVPTMEPDDVPVFSEAMRTQIGRTLDQALARAGLR